MDEKKTYLTSKEAKYALGIHRGPLPTEGLEIEHVETAHSISLEPVKRTRSQTLRRHWARFWCCYAFWGIIFLAIFLPILYASPLSNSSSSYFGRQLTIYQLLLDYSRHCPASPGQWYSCPRSRRRAPTTPQLHPAQHQFCPGLAHQLPCAHEQLNALSLQSLSPGEQHMGKAVHGRRYNQWEHNPHRG